MKAPPPHVAAAFDPTRFATLVLQALTAAQETPSAGPGGVAELRRGPHERALFALRARLPDDAVYRAASRRFLALMQLHATGALAPLTHTGDRGATSFLHPAVLDTAAELSLTRNGRFPPRRFLDAALARARDQYADLAWPPPRREAIA
ncbi:MAG: hypothetical protein KDC48_19540 [Planctomycetes bacterium]|nr:hypothetical protein [Planctomycetota bacterium]